MNSNFRFIDYMMDEFNNFLRDRKIVIENFEKVLEDNPSPIFGSDDFDLRYSLSRMIDFSPHYYSNNDLEANIIEIFEDFLDKKEIFIPNTEKKEAIESGEDIDSIANIYGTDYGFLQESVRDAVKECLDVPSNWIDLYENEYEMEK